MSDTVLQGIIGAASIIIVALIGIITARISRQAGIKQAQVEERVKLIDGYNQLNEDLQEENKRLKESIDKCNQGITQLDDRINALRQRINDLEDEKVNAQRQFRLLVAYTHHLIDILRQHNIEIPPPPSEIENYGAQ